MSSTTANGIPYVSGTDTLTSWPTTSQTLANKVESAYASQKRMAQVSRTSGVYSTTATSISTASDYFASDLTFTSTGASYIVEFFAPYANSPLQVGSYMPIALVNGAGTDLGIIAVVGPGNGSAGAFVPVSVRFPYTFAAGTITLNIRANVVSGTGYIYNGTGGAAAAMPSYLTVYGPDLT